jgi:hypothetical protein
MEIPLNAQVECKDGLCGRSKYVLINPVNDQVTHVVVRQDDFPNTEYVVPVDLLLGTLVDTIQLQCTRAELEKLEPFIKTTYIEEKMSGSNLGFGGEMYGMGMYYYMPYITPVTVKVPQEHKQIPPGELAVRRGTRVEATDGFVGHVDEFVVNPENCFITHLVLREGHLWGQKDVLIPVSAMGETHEDTVFLKLSKQQIEALPTFPVHRRWA